MKLLHILIAEDNDGQAAVAYIDRLGTSADTPYPDVVLLDLNLPKVGGRTILEEFRKDPECQHTPVVVVTSSEAEPDRVNAAALNVPRYFRMPSDFDAFMEIGALIRQVAQ